jgi:proline iminopeptidase
MMEPERKMLTTSVLTAATFLSIGTPSNHSQRVAASHHDNGLVEQPDSDSSSRLTKGEHFADVNGVRIWYTVVGAGPLVIVQAPGWGPSSRYLQNGLSQLTKRFTLLFYDPRGNGRSSRPPEGRMATSDMVDDLDRLRRYWGLRAITLMGHSHGGAIALGYAVRYPESVENLILVDTGIPGYLGLTEMNKALDPRRNDKRFATAIVEANSDAPDPKTDEEFDAQLNLLLPLYFHDPDSNMARFKETMGGLPSAWANESLNSADAKGPMHVIGSMNRVRARTLILVGREDFICSPAIAERVHSEIKDSKLIVFEKTGHFPWIEHANEFFQEVMRFLTRGR